MRLGFHASIAGGIPQVLPRAVRRRCITLQLFTSSPVQWARGPLDGDECRQFAQDLGGARDIRPQRFEHETQEKTD